MPLHRNRMCSMERNRKRWNIVILIAILILVLVLLYSGLQILESTVLRKDTGANQEPSSLTITRDGVDYFPKQDITTILVSGVDTTGPMADSGSYNNSAVSDMVALVIFDESTGKMDILNMNRDTMTNIPVLGIGGKKAGTIWGQLALAHTYGSGLADSSENLRDTVSALLYGAQIDYYVTINMDAIQIINDAVGGVTVNVTDDFSAIDPTISMGRVTLTGDQAVTYLRTRYELGDELNLSRMERHQQYMQGFLEALRAKTESDAGFVLSLYSQVAAYMVTDCSTTAVTGLVDRYGDYELGQILNLEGENVKGKQYMEYHLDEEALDKLILEHLYDPKK